MRRAISRSACCASPQFADAFDAVGRRGRPEEIAALIEFLLGPDARFFCGSVVFCDGGTDAMTRADDIPPPWKPLL